MFDEVNINENGINELFDSINWIHIPLGIIFEFIIKFPQIVSHSKIENSIISAILSKFKEKFKLYKKESAFKENEEISLLNCKVKFI